MKIERIFCDGCGNTLKSEDNAVYVLLSARLKTQINFQGNQLTKEKPQFVNEERHFCETCSDLLEKSIGDIKKLKNYSPDKIKKILNDELDK